MTLLTSLTLVACGDDLIEASGASDGDSSSAGETTTSGGSASASASDSATTTASGGGDSDSATGSTTAVSASESASASASDSESTSTGPDSDSNSDSDSESTTTGDSDSDSDSTTSGGSDSDTEGTTGDSDSDSGGDDEPFLWTTPNLWYSVDKALIYIALDETDGSVQSLVHNELDADIDLWHGQNGLTMLEDGSLLGSRESPQGTQIYYIAEPPITENTPAQAVFLGIVPNDQQNQLPIRIEALYTDCEGRIYLMDTGVDVSSAEGNRLLRFTGNYLGGDLTFEVITDLENASVPDIDDMSPGIVDGEISDSLGFAMDSARLWQIDYTSGTGAMLANTSGTWGIHALGGPLFQDLNPRVYILSAGNANSIGARLMEVYLDDYSSSEPLIEGPNLMLSGGYNGWSGLAGPLTDCMTTIPQ